MNTEKILAWVFYLPPLISLFMFFTSESNPEPEWMLSMFFFGVLGWVLFMCLSFFTGLAYLANPKKYSDKEDFRRLIAGMNLWMLVFSVYMLPIGNFVGILIVGHLFNFSLHFFQTSIFQKPTS